MKTRNLGIQESLDSAAQLYRQRTKAFLAAMDNLPTTSDPTVNESIRMYANGLAECVTGHYEWSFVTERYWGRKLDEKSRDGHELVVELLPLEFEGTSYPEVLLLKLPLISQILRFLPGAILVVFIVVTGYLFAP